MFQRIYNYLASRKEDAAAALRRRNMRADVMRAAGKWFDSTVRQYGKVWQMARAFADGASIAKNDYHIARTERWDSIAQYLNLRYHPITDAEHAEMHRLFFAYTEELFDSEVKARLGENRHEDGRRDRASARSGFVNPLTVSETP